MVFDCYDGACHFLGTLHSDWNGTAYTSIRYADCLTPKSFSASDGDGHIVTFAWNTHNWIIPSDSHSNPYEVLELDIRDFQPCTYTACETPYWWLSPDTGNPITAVWTGIATNDPSCSADWIHKKYLWQSFHYPPFVPCP